MFDRDTYKLIDSAYRIREKCDYSDFFIASKEDSENQIRNAEEFIMRVENFLNAQDMKHDKLINNGAIGEQVKKEESSL